MKHYLVALLVLCGGGAFSAAHATPATLSLQQNTPTDWLASGEVSSFAYPFSASQPPTALFQFDPNGENSLIVMAAPTPTESTRLSLGVRIDSHIFPCPAPQALHVHFPYDDVTIPAKQLACIQGGTVLKPQQLTFSPDIQHKGLFAAQPLRLSQGERTIYISVTDMRPFGSFIQRLLSLSAAHTMRH